MEKSRKTMRRDVATTLAWATGGCVTLLLVLTCGALPCSISNVRSAFLLVGGVWLALGVGLVFQGARTAWRAPSPRARAAVFGVIALSLGLLGTCALLAGSDAKRHPADAQMVEEFRQQRAAFEALRSMFQMDVGVVRIAPDFVRVDDAIEPQTALPPERLADYRRQFKVLKLSAGIEGYGDKSSVHFYRSTLGLSIGGSSKGFAYLETRPDNVVKGNVDQGPRDRSFSAYRHIEGSWYLFYDFED